jgi:spermidine synthase
LRILLFLGLFFLSGAASLAYQIVWSRLFAAGLGHEVPAVLAVLAAIFGGMAAGAWAGDGKVFDHRLTGRTFAWLQFAIGVWGLGTIWLIPLCNDYAVLLIGLEPSALRQWLVAFGLPFVALLPATAAMGATFPALERLVSDCSTRAHLMGAIYAANTFGAVSGVLLCTWWLLPVLGLSTSLAAISCASLVCGGAALLITPGPVIPGLQKPVLRRKAAPQAPVISRPRLALLLATTGLLGIGFEIVGVRVLAQVLENTVFSYAAVLMMFLFGTASGAALYHRAERLLAGRDALRVLLPLLAMSCLAGGVALGFAPVLYSGLRASFFTNLTGVVLAEVLTACSVFVFPTVAMGATLSHLLQLAKDQEFGIGRALGLNTLGSALAPFLIGTMLYPVLGPKWALAILMAGYLLLKPLSIQTLWLAPVCLLIVALLPPLRFIDIPPGGKLLSFRPGLMDAVAVVESSDRNRTLLVNNRFTMGGTGSIPAERRHADMPLLLHPHPKRALFLGLGTGITFAASVAHPSLRADGVELLPEVVQAFPWFAPHNSLPEAPGRFRVITADARRFVRVSPDRYDVIVADLFHPARDGAASLYSIEHFEAIRQHLEPGGLFCQWLPLFQLDDLTLRTIVRTFLTVFPKARAYLLRFNIDTPVLGLIGTMNEIAYGPVYFADRVPARSALAEQLTSEQLRDGFHLFGCFISGPDALRRFAGAGPLNSDDHPVVLFTAPKLTGTDPRTIYQRLFRLLDDYASNPLELFPANGDTDSAFVRRLADFLAARNAYLKGLAAETEGHTERGIDLYVQSARQSVDFTTSYAQCLTLAMQRLPSNPQDARRLLQRLAEAQPNRPVAAQLLERLDSARNH